METQNSQPQPQPPVRVAQPGDVFLLLEPDEADLPSLERRQAALRAVFGGEPHRPVHLTIQRYSGCGEHEVRQVIDHLRKVVESTQPFDIDADDLILIESPFWGHRLLRWSIAPQPALFRLMESADLALEEAGIERHYNGTVQARYRSITALEAVPAPDPEAFQAARAGVQQASERLYSVGWLRVSEVQGPRQFKTWARLALNGGYELA